MIGRSCVRAVVSAVHWVEPQMAGLSDVLLFMDTLVDDFCFLLYVSEMWSSMRRTQEITMCRRAKQHMTTSEHAPKLVRLLTRRLPRGLALTK
jgi:hypothetical protein